MNFETIKIGNQILLPFEFEGEFYYVRFVRRGSGMDCSGVYQFVIEGERVVPSFRYQNKSAVKIQKLIKAARLEVGKD